MFAEESSLSKKDSSMGFLSDATYEQGFTRKRRRSVVPRDRESSYLRQCAHLHRIHAPEIEDLD
ncbi:hypothetical protein OROHE_015943 [Orobanche hederae]